jgi:1,6-anhydro-N-acetylmuramate kinase
MQDIKAYEAECQEMKAADDETRILLSVLEAQQNRSEEEWLQGGGINNEELLKRLQEVWDEEDRMIAEAI